MADDILAKLVAQAEMAANPVIPQKLSQDAGGVDPLGLRQTNFDLMDKVFPGLNNVARHVRPFVVVSWAWRRALQLTVDSGRDSADVDQMQDFVARIEVIYAWSVLMSDPNARLPGRLELKPLLNATRWTFGDDAWRDRRRRRRTTTALSAPVTYGPGLKALHWLEDRQGVMVAGAWVDPALDALEKRLGPHLKHPAFSKFGRVVVKATDVRSWAGAWALTKPTPAERETALTLTFGDGAAPGRRQGAELMRAARKHFNNEVAPAQIREVMAGAPSKFRPSNALSATSLAWRRLQDRQLFRLCLEAVLHWIMVRLSASVKPRTTTSLVAQFGKDAGGSHTTVGRWLQARDITGQGPVTLIQRVEEALTDPTGKAQPGAIIDGLAYCLMHVADSEKGQRDDRLPIARAQREAQACWHKSPEALVRLIVERWVLAQHSRWAVERGLGDARARGRERAILRLRVMLDEGGWTLAPGVKIGRPPIPTPDRLETALNLAAECGYLD